MLYTNQDTYMHMLFYIVAFSIHIYMYKDAKKRKYDTFSAIRSYQDTYLNEGWKGLNATCNQYPLHKKILEMYSDSSKIY